MKKLFLLAIVATLLTATSCNITNRAQSYYKKHCKGTALKNSEGKIEITFECDSLYKTAKIKKYVDEAIITYDVANARVYGGATAADTPSLKLIFKALRK